MSPGLGRSPGEENGNPLQYYCLENPMDRGAWQAAVYGVAQSRTRLSNFTSLQQDELFCCVIIPFSSVAQLCSTLCDPIDCSLPGCPWHFPGNSTGVGCHFLLQGIFPTQGSNPGLPHCRQTLYSLEPPGKSNLYLRFSATNISPKSDTGNKTLDWQPQGKKN